MRLDLTTLRLFLAVVEERSIARAAKREHLTGPAISRRITEIEQLFGVHLLERHSSGTRPTPVGTMLAAEARSMLGTMDRLRAKLSEHADGSRGEVRVTSSASGLAGRLPEDLKKFVTDYPNVALELKERHSPGVIQAIKEGDADLGVFVPHPAVYTGGLEVLPYEEGRLVLVTPMSHPLSKRRTVNLAAAVKYEFVGSSGDTTVGRFLNRAAKERRLEFRKRIEVQGHEPVRRLVQAGMGLGILPEWAVPYAQAVNLCCIPFSDRLAHYAVHICTRPRATLSISARRLLIHLIQGNAGIRINL